MMDHFLHRRIERLLIDHKDPRDVLHLRRDDVARLLKEAIAAAELRREIMALPANDNKATATLVRRVQEGKL